MTISTTVRKKTYDGNSSTTSWTFPFIIPKASQLVVTYTDADGVETTIDASLYTVTGLNSKDGGSVTYPKSGSAIANGTKLTISRVVAYDQDTSIENQPNFYPKVLENALDYLTMQTQQLAEKIGRAVVLKISSALSNIELPEPGAGKYLRWNSGGTALEAVAIVPSADVAEASETDAGIAEIATQTEVDTGTDDLKFVTPKKLAGQIATQDEVDTGTDDAKFITPETFAGQIATQAEVVTGTNDTKIVTPKKLAGVVVQKVTAVSADKSVAATDFPGAFNCTAAVTLALGDPADVTPNVPLTIINSSTGVLTVTPLAGDTIDGTSANYTVPVGSRITMISTGSAWIITQGAQHAGAVLQVVAATDAGKSTTSTSAVALTTTQVSITPKSTSSKLLIEVSGEAGITSPSGVTHSGVIDLAEGTTTITNDNSFGVNVAGSGMNSPIVVRAVKTNAALTARAFGVIGSVTSGGTLSVTNQTLTITEIAT